MLFLPVGRRCISGEKSVQVACVDNRHLELWFFTRLWRFPHLCWCVEVNGTNQGFSWPTRFKAQDQAFPCKYAALYGYLCASKQLDHVNHPCSALNISDLQLTVETDSIMYGLVLSLSNSLTSSYLPYWSILVLPMYLPSVYYPGNLDL